MAAKILGVLPLLPLLVSISLLAFSLSPINSSKSTPPRVEWIKTYGGLRGDVGWAVRQTRDGGYIIIGTTSSYGEGEYDAWLIKTDEHGEVEWNRTYGGVRWDVGWSLEETSDGGYILAGETSSWGSGHYDIWLIKLSSRGDEEWSLVYGWPDWDIGYCVKELRDGGYIVAGCTRRTRIIGSGYWDALLLRIDPLGRVLWCKTYGGPYEDGAWHVSETRDGGLVVAGYTTISADRLADAWVIKTDEFGDVEWDVVYGGDGDDWLFSIEETEDGYIAAGATGSYGAGGYDFWLVKLDGDGEVLWNRTYGGAGSDIGWLVRETKAGGYIIIGGTTSYGKGDWDIWVVETDEDGDPLWNQTYGGVGRDRGWCIDETVDGGYILVGYTTPKNSKYWDAILLKLSPERHHLGRILTYVSAILTAASSIPLVIGCGRRFRGR